MGTTVARVILAILALSQLARAQSTQYFAGDGSALTASEYSAPNGSPTGLFTAAFTSSNIIGFGIAFWDGEPTRVWSDIIDLTYGW